LGVEDSGDHMRSIQTDLAHYRSIQEWVPQVGDIVIHHGWITHWFGIVTLSDQAEGIVEVIKSGLPVFLVTMSGSKQKKSKITLDVSDVKAARSGKYAIIKTIQNLAVWHV
jgi:hypothetical protein